MSVTALLCEIKFHCLSSRKSSVLTV
jgi:hypothetical protein